MSFGFRKKTKRDGKKKKKPPFTDEYCKVCTIPDAKSDIGPVFDYSLPEKTAHPRAIQCRYPRVGLDNRYHQTNELDKRLPWYFLVGGRNRMAGALVELVVGFVAVALSHYSR